MSEITINIYENDNFFNISNNSDSQILSAHSGNSGISGNSGLAEPPFGDVVGDFMGRHGTPAEVADCQKYHSDSTFPSLHMLTGQYETYARIGLDIVNGINSSVSELGTPPRQQVKYQCWNNPLGGQERVEVFNADREKQGRYKNGDFVVHQGRGYQRWLAPDGRLKWVETLDPNKAYRSGQLASRRGEIVQLGIPNDRLKWEAPETLSTATA